MSKQDWNPADIGTESKMNQPFWIGSGIVSGNNVVLSITPGRMRYPNQTAVVFSGQPTNCTIVDAAAATYYTVFKRSSGAYVVSGSTSPTVPGPPRWDAEPIGQIFTGASLATNNLKFPGNAGAFDLWEQRGEAPTVMASRPRAYHDSNVLNSHGAGSFPFASHSNATTASGISYLSFVGPTEAALGVHVMARVRWVASGALTAGLLYVNPVFSIKQASTVAAIASHDSCYVFPVAQNPDTTHGANRGALQVNTATLHVFDPNPAGQYEGYKLTFHFGTNTDDAPIEPDIRILAWDMTAIPGIYAINRTDPA